MQIKINIKILLFIGIFLISGQIEIYGIFMLFALIHELGHLLVGILLGLKLDYLTIMPLGLSITFKTDISDYTTTLLKINKLVMKRILIAMAGPFVNLLLVIIFIITKIDIYIISNSTLIYTNLIIGIFNLIPIYPLDGGRIIGGFLRAKYGIKKSIIYSNTINYISIVILTVLASVTIYYYKNIAILIAIVYLWFLVFIQKQKSRLKVKIYNIVEKNSCKTI